MTRTQLSELTTLACTAAAALLPLNHDGIGADSHGGKLANPSETLARALDALEAAGRMAAQIRANGGASCEARGVPRKSAGAEAIARAWRRLPWVP